MVCALSVLNIKKGEGIQAKRVKTTSLVNQYPLTNKETDCLK